MRPGKIAITGASGFIGRHLADALVAAGHKVLCLGRSESSLAKIEGDVLRHVTDFSTDDLAIALQGVDVLVHLAGKRTTREDDRERVAPFASDALTMLDNVLSAAKANGVKRVVTASSIAVYSTENTMPWTETEWPKPGWPYGLMKLFCEQAADFWSPQTGIPVAHMRLAAAYGHGEKGTPALMHFASEASAGKQLKVTNGGIYTIDQIYIEDAVCAVLALIASEATGAFNIGSGQGYSVREIAETVNAVYGNDSEVIVEPMTNDAESHLSRHMDISRAGRKLGWHPAYTLETGLAAMRAAALEKT